MPNHRKNPVTSVMVVTSIVPVCAGSVLRESSPSGTSRPEVSVCSGVSRSEVVGA